jgi:hypothetical protein
MPQHLLIKVWVLIYVFIYNGMVSIHFRVFLHILTSLLWLWLLFGWEANCCNTHYTVRLTMVCGVSRKSHTYFFENLATMILSDYNLNNRFSMFHFHHACIHISHRFLILLLPRRDGALGQILIIYLLENTQSCI